MTVNQDVADSIPVGRKGTTMDIAFWTGFLVSDAGAYLSGIDIIVDGGTLSSRRSTGLAVFR